MLADAPVRKLHDAGFKVKVKGGGRIDFDPDARRVLIFGYRCVRGGGGVVQHGTTFCLMVPAVTRSIDSAHRAAEHSGQCCYSCYRIAAIVVVGR